MRVSLPRSDPWTSHLARRWNEAIELGLSTAETPLPRCERATIFVPREVDTRTLAASHPRQSLRSLLKASPPSSEWVRREDLFGEAADWLHEEFQSDSRAELYCEAGLSRAGDRSLIDLPHVVHQASPLLYLNISATNSKVIVDILRRGRSPLRFLGVVVLNYGNAHQAPRMLFADNSAVLFMCDALDGDSLIVVALDG
jgi:hypothetical protein